MFQLERTENTRKEVEKLREKKKLWMAELAARREEHCQKREKFDKMMEKLERIRHQHPELYKKNYESMEEVKKQQLLVELYQLRNKIKRLE